MEVINISIEKFLEQFGNEYQFLYDNCDRVAGFDDAIQEFDYRMAHDPKFNRLVCEFVDYRQDFISSDREAAAFMFTFAEYEPA